MFCDRELFVIEFRGFIVHVVVHGRQETTKACCVCFYSKRVWKGEGAAFRTNTQANYPALQWVSAALHSGCLYRKQQPLSSV